jgi:hypothetical protein
MTANGNPCHAEKDLDDADFLSLHELAARFGIRREILARRLAALREEIRWVYRGGRRTCFYDPIGAWRLLKPEMAAIRKYQEQEERRHRPTKEDAPGPPLPACEVCAVCPPHDLKLARLRAWIPILGRERVVRLGVWCGRDDVCDGEIDRLGVFVTLPLTADESETRATVGLAVPWEPWAAEALREITMVMRRFRK